MLVILDSGPLGLLSNPVAGGLAEVAWEWAQAVVAAGYRLVVPEIADYEVRRELLRADRPVGPRRRIQHWMAT